MEFLYEKHSPWWQDPDLIEQDPHILEFKNKRYQYHHPYLKEIPLEPGIFVLRGPRQVGKTTLQKLFVRELVTKRHDQVDPTQIMFYPCDRIRDFNELYELLVGFLGTREKGLFNIIILDEISVVSEWQRAVKDLWDSGDLRNTLLIITGSNALDLKVSSERLPGRLGAAQEKEWQVLPLTFSELVQLVGDNKSPEQLFFDYLICGGFPLSINEYFTNGYISNGLYSIYLSWIEGDIHRVKKNPETFYLICKELLASMTSTTSWYRIAKKGGISSHTTVSDYVELAQSLFVFFPISHYSIAEQRIQPNKNKKLYFFDPFIFNAIAAKIDGFSDRYFDYSTQKMNEGPFLSRLVENTVAHHLLRSVNEKMHLCYGWYREREVDFVKTMRGENTYLEVKFRNRPKLKEFDFWDQKQKLEVLTKGFKAEKSTLRFCSVWDKLLEN